LEEAVKEIKLEEIFENDELKTHNDILHTHAYTIKELKENHAKIEISAQRCQRVKESGYIYNGDLFSAASFAATAAINDSNFTLIGSNIDFLNPLKEEGEIILYADVEINGSVKKIVKVVGKLNDIEFLRGDFSLVKVDA
jgi:acyl-coenzyme A thioesterase PaaI-like protein